MSKVGIYCFIEVDWFGDFLRELKLPADSDHHLSTDILFYIFFDDRLSILRAAGNCKDDVGLDLFLHSVRLCLILKVDSVCLYPLEVDLSLFYDIVLVYLQPKITEETLLFLVLNRPVHEVLTLRLWILNWVVFEKFKIFLFYRLHTHIF